MGKLAACGTEVPAERRAGRARAEGERTLLMRWSDLPGIELLRADFRNHAFLPHWHDAYMIAATALGSERVRHNRVEHVVGPGTLALLNPGELHDGEALDPTVGWHFRVLYVSPEAMSDFAEDGPHPLHFESALVEDARGAAIFLDLHRQLEHSSSQLQRESQFTDALSRLLRIASVSPAHSAPLAPARLPLDRAREFLNAEWARPISLQELSTVAGLSRYHLLRTFRQRFGLPPHAYQVQLRVLRAKNFLFAGMAAKDAAQEAGFCDQAHLTHALRRYTGATPGCVRSRTPQ